MNPTDAPLVSAIIRSMDRATLVEALDAVAAQTHARVEIVVVNAKGPGHRPLADRHGGAPLRFVDHAQPLARSRAANAGLDAARGEWLFFLDDDDLVDPDHVSGLLRALAGHPSTRGAYAGVRVQHYRDGRLHAQDVLSQRFDRRRLWGRNFLPIHAVLFHRSLLAEGCRFDEALEVYEDWDFWVQVTARTDLVHVEQVSACYRNHGQSGFGLEHDPDFIRRAKAAYFEKWRARWSAEDLGGIVDCREELLGDCIDRANRQQAEHAAELRVRDERSAEQADRLARQADELAHQRQQAEQQAARAADLDQALQAERQASSDARQQVSALQQALQQSEHAAAQGRREADELQRALRAAQGQQQAVQAQLQQAREQLQAVYGSRSWRLTAPYRWAGTTLRRLRKLRTLAAAYAAEHGGGASGYLSLAAQASRVLVQGGPNALAEAARRRAVVRHPPPAPVAAVADPAQRIERPALQTHAAPVDVIVCVHNALDDVRRCLESVLRHASGPYELILVDDGSAEPTREYLAQFAAAHGATLLRNDTASGYTLAANQGMRAARSPYRVLLNSDTIVGERWLDRLVACAESDPAIGIVGPLSNTASWQSIPAIEQSGDWAPNPLPEGLDVDGMARLVAAHAARAYPRIPFLNGFCLLIRRELADRIGLFDEEGFARGYGEENDYCLRAGKAGFALAVADDAYVYHAQSKSYSSERRKQLSELAGATLARKHGQPLIDAGVQVCRFDRVMEGLRAHASNLYRRHELIGRARPRWAGRRVVFILPVVEAGGGANIVMCEAAAMQRMGVEVRLLNFARSRTSFEAHYPGLGIPVLYASDEAAIPALCEGADAVVATLNTSVFWIAPLRSGPGPRPVLGYYVQDYEPNFYDEGSAGQRSAEASYTAVADMVCVTKTRWNADTVLQRTGRRCTVVGPSYDVDLFRPRLRPAPSWPQGPLRIVAMIRPSSPRRGPGLTMEVLRAVEHAYRERVEILLFGVDPAAPEFLALPHDFAWTNLGTQSPEQVALLLNRADIFVDFSHYQAMGLTAMEAMACGAAVVLPEAGGADSFARHEANALIVDTMDRDACHRALCRLLDDDALRQRLQRQALADIGAHVPEEAAFRILQALFDAASDGAQPPGA